MTQKVAKEVTGNNFLLYLSPQMPLQVQILSATEPAIAHSLSGAQKQHTRAWKQEGPIKKVI